MILPQSFWGDHLRWSSLSSIHPRLHCYTWVDWEIVKQEIKHTVDGQDQIMYHLAKTVERNYFFKCMHHLRSLKEIHCIAKGPGISKSDANIRILLLLATGLYRGSQKITDISQHKHPAGLFTVPRKHIIFYFAMAKPSFWTWNWYHRFFRFFVFFCVIYNPYSVLWPTTMRTQTPPHPTPTPLCCVASNMCATSTMSLLPTAPQPPCLP